MAFYGAIEQVLTGWIFDILPTTDADIEQAKEFIVETVVRRTGAPRGVESLRGRV